MTVGEAIAVNTLWDKRRRVTAFTRDEWEAFWQLAKVSYRVLQTGVTPADVEAAAFRFGGHDIRGGVTAKGASI
jgi:hypothetical protein